MGRILPARTNATPHQGGEADMRLQGKIAVVTGASSGMGLAIAERFAAEGAHVVAGDINAPRLHAAVAQITAAGGSIVGLDGNIADRAHAEALVDLAVERFGAIDILVNNAGIMDYMQSVAEVDDAVYRRVMAVNLDGPLFTMRRAAQHMLAAGRGSIINIASTAALHGGAAGAVYTASKHALLGLTRNTAWQYARRGIRCNAICPGGTVTNIAESMPAERLDPVGAARAGEFAAIIPGYLMPHDIANLALYLASDESRMINGAVITADGGWDAA